MVPTDLKSLSTFLAVAEERGFTKAARRLGVSPSAVSHSMRALEEEVGVRLLARTTRSVGLTEAGQQLLNRLAPALTEIGETLEEISGRRNKAIGRVRLLIPRLAAMTVLAPKLGQISRDYPDIVLDVTTDDSRRDIVADGFDAGIHFGEYIEKDMIAVRVSADLKPMIVGSPSYLQSHPRPREPRDLLKNRCINFRHRSPFSSQEADTGATGLVSALPRLFYLLSKPSAANCCSRCSGECSSSLSTLLHWKPTESAE
jgi:DNA-binding transcriptional LysR family regulator